MSPMDYSYFEADGTLRLSGEATVWNDINVSALALGPGATPPDPIAIASSSIIAQAFAGTGAVTEELHGSLEVLHDWKEGSVIFPHIHWAPTTTGAGNVKWQMEYIWVNLNQPLTTSTTISRVVPAGGVAWRENGLPLSTTGVDGTGKLMASRFAFRIFRDPTDPEDTYEADAILLDVGIHYEIDTMGSREILTK